MKDFYSWITKVCSCIHAAFISGITCATGLSTAGECLCVCRGKRRCNSKRLSHLVWLLPFKRNVGLGIFLSDFIIHWRVITHFVSIISWQAADASGVGQMGGFHRDEKTEEQNAGISSWAVQALSYAVRFLCYQMKTSSIMIFTIILVLPLFLFCSSVWSLWQTRLQHRRDLHILEDQAQKQRALTLKTRVRAWSNTPVNHMLILLSIVIIKITITFFNTAPFKTKWQTTKCLRRIKSETT